MTADVAVLDYGSGNVRSVVRALERVGAEVTLTDDLARASGAGGLVVPGVGAYAACMRGLRAVQGDKIIGRRLAGGRPVLGICVGMQVMYDQGVEHGMVSEGCGELPGSVERLEAPVVPHMGWNTVEAATASAMLAGLGSERFYFVHSYGVRAADEHAAGRATGRDEPTTPSHPSSRPALVSWSEHGGDRFAAAVEHGPLWTTQFHPEKSGDAGAALLRTWVERL